jgi:ketosteroid isomerase-like protein
MTDREAIKAMIGRTYEARRTNDLEGLLALFHPEARFELAGSKQHTQAVGAAQGHQELRMMLASLIAAFQFVGRDIIATVIEGNQAAVHSRVTVRFIPKDQTVTTDLLDLWKFQDGKIVELVEFADTALVNHLML